MVTGSLLIMHNGQGHVLGRCWYCKEYTDLEVRVEDDVGEFWNGWYCDDCCHWIEVDEEHWRLFYLLRQVDPSQSHKLVECLCEGKIGRTLAEFTGTFSWSG